MPFYITETIFLHRFLSFLTSFLTEFFVFQNIILSFLMSFLVSFLTIFSPLNSSFLLCTVPKTACKLFKNSLQAV